MKKQKPRIGIMIWPLQYFAQCLEGVLYLLQAQDNGKITIPWGIVIADKNLALRTVISRHSEVDVWIIASRHGEIYFAAKDFMRNTLGDRTPVIGVIFGDDKLRNAAEFLCACQAAVDEQWPEDDTATVIPPYASLTLEEAVKKIKEMRAENSTVKTVTAY